MNLSLIEKEQLKLEVVEKLKDYPTLQKIIIFGSFLSSSDPQDIDIAVIDSSGKDYILLAVDYGLRLSSINIIDIDLIPVVESKFEKDDSFFTQEIKKGEIVNAKRCINLGKVCSGKFQDCRNYVEGHFYLIHVYRIVSNPLKNG